MGLLDGKVAIVTGASRGIGAEIARRFGSEGAAVVVAARTTQAGQSPLAGTIGETAEAIRAAGGTAIAVPADLSKPGDRERLVAETTRQLGAPDILVNNAAVTYFTRVEDFTPRRYQLMLQVQVASPVPPRHPGTARNARARARLDPEHLLPGRAAPGDPAHGVGRARRHRLRDVQGRARAVLHRPGRGALCRTTSR